MFILIDETDNGVLAIWISSTALVIILAVALIALSVMIYVRVLRPRMMMRRQMQFSGRPHPEEMLGQDPLLVDPVTLASPWSYREAIDDGNVYYVSRVLCYETLDLDQITLRIH